MKKERLTIEDRLLIEQLIKLNYKQITIANILDVESSTISRELKKRRIMNPSKLPDCDKTKRFPFVCNGCTSRANCKKRKYYYNYKRAHSNYITILSNSRRGIDMSLDELDYWNDYFKDKIKDKNQPILHIFNELNFPKSIQTFYSYVHKGYFSNINDEMLPRSFSYKPRKRTEEDAKTIRNDNVIRKDRTLKEFNEYLIKNPNANVVEMDTVIGKFEDKNCILTLYFRNTKLMLMFLVKKYKTNDIKKVFDYLKEKLEPEIFKNLFEVILTDNGWEFSKPLELETDSKTGEKLISIFYTEPYSSWQKGGIERNHEFIRYIIPKGISFDNLTKKNVKDMMNHINNVQRKSLEYKTPYKLFLQKNGENITKQLHLKQIPKDEVNLSYKLLNK